MRVELTEHNNNLIVELGGELDEATAPSLRTALDDRIAQTRYNGIIFDLSMLDFMDSTGIGVLIGRYRKLRGTNVGIYVKNPNRQVDRLLKLSGLYSIIKKIS